MLKDKGPEPSFCLLGKYKPLPRKQRALLQRLGNKWFKSIKIYISFLPIHSKPSITYNPEHTRCKSAKKSPLKYKSFQVYHPITRTKRRAKPAPIYTHNTISGNLSCLLKVIYTTLQNSLLTLNQELTTSPPTQVTAIGISETSSYNSFLFIKLSFCNQLFKLASSNKMKFVVLREFSLLCNATVAFQSP